MNDLTNVGQSGREIVVVGGEYGQRFALVEGMTLETLKTRRNPRPLLCRLHLHWWRKVGDAWVPDFGTAPMIDVLWGAVSVGRKLKRCSRCGAVREQVFD
jgi:hypothetical protein